MTEREIAVQAQPGTRRVGESQTTFICEGQNTRPRTLHFDDRPFQYVLAPSVRERHCALLPQRVTRLTCS